MDSPSINPSKGFAGTLTSKILSLFQSESPAEVLQEVTKYHTYILETLHEHQGSIDVVKYLDRLDPLRLRSEDKNLTLKGCKDLLSETISLYNEVQKVSHTARTELLRARSEAVRQAPNPSNPEVEISSPFPVPPAVLPPPAETPPDLSDPSLGVSVRVGPIAWGLDVVGEVRGLIQLLPLGYTGSQHFSAQLDEDKSFALVHFPSAPDAISFDNSWTSRPPVGFEGATTGIQPERAD